MVGYNLELPILYPKFLLGTLSSAFSKSRNAKYLGVANSHDLIQGKYQISGASVWSETMLPFTKFSFQNASQSSFQHSLLHFRYMGQK